MKVLSAIPLFISLSTASLPFLAGLNTAGYDFSVVSNIYILVHSG
jgi:hypothetical protein